MAERAGSAADAPRAADAQQAFADAWAQAAARRPRHPGRRREGHRRQVQRLRVPGVPRRPRRLYKPVLEKFAKSHPGAVKYVVKDWPWNTTCNFNATPTIPGHEAACDAAAAARMARDAGKYDEMDDVVYANQGDDAGRRFAGSGASGSSASPISTSEYAPKLPDIRRDIADGGVLAHQARRRTSSTACGCPSGTAAAAVLRAGDQHRAEEGGASSRRTPPHRACRPSFAPNA